MPGLWIVDTGGKPELGLLEVNAWLYEIEELLRLALLLVEGDEFYEVVRVHDDRQSGRPGKLEISEL